MTPFRLGMLIISIVAIVAAVVVFVLGQTRDELPDRLRAAAPELVERYEAAKKDLSDDEQSRRALIEAAADLANHPSSRDQVTGIRHEWAQKLDDEALDQWTSLGVAKVTEQDTKVARAMMIVFMQQGRNDEARALQEQVARIHGTVLDWMTIAQERWGAGRLKDGDAAMQAALKATVNTNQRSEIKSQLQAMRTQALRLREATKRTPAPSTS